MPGLDPGIHTAVPLAPSEWDCLMDCRVKPTPREVGNDEREGGFGPDRDDSADRVLRSQTWNSASSYRCEAALTLLRVLLALLCLAPGLAFAAEPSFPALTGRVVDQANLLDAAAKARIEGKLAALEQKTGDQLVVVTLTSLQGYDIADYGYRLGRAWGIGQKGKNNGVLLIVAPNERKARIEVGYGLEGTLTDALTRVILDQGVFPAFRGGDYAKGIERGVDDIVKVLTGDAAEVAARGPTARPEADDPIASIVAAIVIIFVLVIILSSLFGGGRRGRRGYTPVIFPGGFGGGWGSSGGASDGGFSDGGFSGGGGSFGGGGSSGSW